MKRAIIIAGIVIIVLIAAVVVLVVWHNKTCADKFEKTLALESTTRDELVKTLKTEDPVADTDKIYASDKFETVIKMYEEISRDCKNHSQSAIVSLERLKKLKESAEKIIKAEEEEKKIATELGIDYKYLKNFPEGARVTYYYGEGNQETIDFSDYVCLKYSDALHGEYQDIFRIDLKSPLKDGPADYFSSATVIIPGQLEKNKYVAVGNIDQTDAPAKSNIYFKFYLPEYINYNGKKIFFKMNDLVNDSGSIVILDPLDNAEGDNVKLLGRDLLVNKIPDGTAAGRVSIEINIVCHSVQQ